MRDDRHGCVAWLHGRSIFQSRLEAKGGEGKVWSEDDLRKENSGEESLSYPLFGVAQQTPTAGEGAGNEQAGETESSDQPTFSLTDTQALFCSFQHLPRHQRGCGCHLQGASLHRVDLCGIAQLIHIIRVGGGGGTHANLGFKFALFPRCHSFWNHEIIQTLQAKNIYVSEIKWSIFVVILIQVVTRCFVFLPSGKFQVQMTRISVAVLMYAGIWGCVSSYLALLDDPLRTI